MPVFVPSTPAPTHAGRFRAGPPVASPWLSGQGVAFLTDLLGANARIIVWAAFGANLKADPSTWQWYDITTDVRQADGQRISISPMGRSDETSQTQPAGCTFQIDNTSGDYTANHPGSRWWPYVRRNTPIRVDVNLTGLLADSVVQYQGYANGWVPSWDISGNLAVVTVSASGILRRLNQGKTPTRSALYRAITTVTPAPVAYWSLEGGKLITDPIAVIGSAAMVAAPGSAASHVTTGVFSGTVDGPLGGDTTVDMSSGGQLSGGVSGTSGTSWRLGIGFRYKEQAAAADDTTVVTIRTVDSAGNPGWWRFSAAPTGGTNWAWEYGIENPLNTFLDTGSPPLDDGNWHWLEITAADGSGTNANVTVAIDGVQVVTDTNSGFIKAGSVTSVVIADSGDLHTAAHLAVWPTNAALSKNIHDAFGGYAGETVTARLARVCAEESIPLDITGISDTLMGPQSLATPIALLRECEATDDGLLYDGLGPGLGYITRQSRYNRSASITLDMAADPPQVGDPFEPRDDDQRNRNIAKVDRKGGSSATFEDETSALGTDAIQDYDTSVTVNSQTDDVLLARAAWEVHKGTTPGFRYPTLSFDLAATPALAAAWLATPLGGRADVANVTSKATQHPPGTVSLLVEGYGTTLSPFDWQVAANCSPFDPWRVLVLQGDVAEFRWRVDAANSTLHQDYPAGTTSIQVDVNDGYLWSTAAGDYPRDLDIAGVKVTATAAAGTSNPQTFTVTATAYRLLAGSRVKLWKPGVIAL